MTNFFIAIIFLLQADSWSELMITVTMLHLLVWLPISPKTKNIHIRSIYSHFKSHVYTS